ncbi:MAG: hypothetical protein P1U83_18760 [Roseovarius sp.]|nr:hypothetical protein [Roseovarius sp.]
MNVLPRIRLIPLVLALALTGISLPSSSRAQTYPIDCAILLCLSGGWPASVPCARARAEFIRRITPWPVEPPLQIWRCPMGASHEFEPQPHGRDQVFDALFQTDETRPGQPFPDKGRAHNSMTEPAVWRFGGTSDDLDLVDLALRLVQDRADIDISGPEFNFVRSIRVFDTRFASQRVAGENDQCRRYALVYLGTYGAQGEFSWSVSAPTALPDAHVGLKGWGSDCPSLYNRSVFVDWRDYEGNYGFEQVNY